MDTPTKDQLTELFRRMYKPTHKERIEDFRCELHNMLENYPDESIRRRLSAKMWAKFIAEEKRYD